MKNKLMILLFAMLTAVAVFGEDTGDPVREALRGLDFQIIEKNTNYIDFSLTDINGAQVNLKDFQGKIIMLNFWASWCPPCREEMPSMEAFYSKMKGRNFEMLAVNIQENESTVKNFLQKNRYTFPVLMDLEGVAAQKYKIRSIPTTFIIDSKGKIAGVFTGSRDWNSANVLKAFTEITR